MALLQQALLKGILDHSCCEELLQSSNLQSESLVAHIGKEISQHPHVFHTLLEVLGANQLSHVAERMGKSYSM